MVGGLHQRKAVIAKLGMDAHWRGAIVIANALRDAGMEVVYVGHATAAELVATVVQEDPVILGLSALSGNHLEEVPRVIDALRIEGATDVAVVVGGAIPDADVAALLETGVAGVYPTGSAMTAILADLERVVADVEQRRGYVGDLPT